jgi:hypothetical protein
MNAPIIFARFFERLDVVQGRAAQRVQTIYGRMKRRIDQG